MRNESAVDRSRCTLRDYLRREPALLSERLDIAKRILAAVARRHESGRPAGRIDLDTITLAGVRSFRVDLTDDGPVSGLRRRGAGEDLDNWAVNDVRALGQVLVELLTHPDLPPGPARVLASMTSDTDPYGDARLAMNAFARSVP